MTVALVGAHRTGKTTLARLYAQRAGIRFLETSVSAIWRDLGLDPAALYDFETRLSVQEEILRRIDDIYARHAGEDFITDRSPLDMAAYLLGDAIGDRVPEHLHGRVKKYVEDCFHVTNKRFGVVILIQPGIQLVAEEGKAAMNLSYIEHLNSLMFGLCVDERLKCHHYYMPRAVLDLEERLEAVKNSIARSNARVEQEYMEANRAGRILIH